MTPQQPKRLRCAVRLGLRLTYLRIANGDFKVLRTAMVAAPGVRSSEIARGRTCVQPLARSRVKQMPLVKGASVRSCSRKCTPCREAPPRLRLVERSGHVCRR